jgi:hypothetical protein
MLISVTGRLGVCDFCWAFSRLLLMSCQGWKSVLSHLDFEYNYLPDCNEIV